MPNSTKGSKSGAHATLRKHALAISRRLCSHAATLSFSSPVKYVYNPLDYAWKPYSIYVNRFLSPRCRVLFLGMNPGPFGMAQTGIPFGDVTMVREWIGIQSDIIPPKSVHPRRPVQGFFCTRGEVSGQRLWGLFQSRFTTVRTFFKSHFVENYCPLIFLEESGRNRTPDKLPRQERDRLVDLCNRALRDKVTAITPQWVIGIGAFAATRARDALSDTRVNIGQILHPSPASPAANRGWAETVTKQLGDMGVWE